MQKTRAQNIEIWPNSAHFVKMNLLLFSLKIRFFGHLWKNIVFFLFRSKAGMDVPYGIGISANEIQEFETFVAECHHLYGSFNFYKGDPWTILFTKSVYIFHYNQLNFIILLSYVICAPNIYSILANMCWTRWKKGCSH